MSKWCINRNGILLEISLKKIFPSQHLLSGSFSLDNVRVNANYKLSIDKIGEAPANTASGQASLVAEKVFADFVFMVDGNGLPAGIQSWRARVGRRTYLGVSEEFLLVALYERLHYIA